MHTYTHLFADVLQVVLTVSQIMWCCDLTQCLTATEGSVAEEVKQAEQRCIQVYIHSIICITLYAWKMGDAETHLLLLHTYMYIHPTLRTPLILCSYSFIKLGNLAVNLVPFAPVAKCTC